VPEKKLEGESRPLTKRAVIFGFLLGILYTFVGIYLSYKVGIVAMGGIFLLGYVLLQLTGKYDYKENVILIIIVTSCLLPAFEISDNIAALVIYGEYSGHNIPISFPLLFLMAAVGSLLGIFLLMPFKKQFLKLKWPMVQPSAKMVKAIGGGKQEKKRAFGSMALSAVIAAVTRIGGFSTLGLPSLPSFIGFEVSPMMAGLGFFISFAGFALLAVGATYSLSAWFFLEGANPNLAFQDHIMHPSIFSTAIGLMVTTALIAIVRNRAALMDAFRSLRTAAGRKASGSLPIWLTPLSMIVLPLATVAMLYLALGFLQSVALEVFYIVVIGVPIVLVAAFFVVMSWGEVGFSSSFSVDMVLVLAMFLFAPDIAIVLIAFSFLNAYEISSTRVMRNLKLGSLTEVAEKDVLKATLLATLPGAFIGAGTVWIFANIFGGLGTDVFPCPGGYVTGGYVLMVREALVHGVLPPMYDLRFLLIGVASAIVFSYIQSRMKIGAFSPITLAIGMLIPPTYVFPMFLGAALDIYLSKRYGRDRQTYDKERQKWTVINSGLFAGEGLILMIVTFASLLPLMFGS
jgi:uncharacterized oligopeptide transporter (OPT) family protein